MNRRDRRAARARDRAPEPPSNGDADATRERMRKLLDLLKANANGLGFVLLTAPNGTDFLTMEHVASGTNLPREQAAQLMSGFLDYWRGRNLSMPEPDSQTVQLMRSLVPGLTESDIPTDVLARKAVDHAAKLAATLPRVGVGDHQWTESIAVACEWLAVASRVRPKAEAPEGVPLSKPDSTRLSLFEALRLEVDRNAGKWPPGDTKETLVADLLEKPDSPDRNRLIGFAKAGLFHDYDSELPMPKLNLLEALLMMGYDDLAQKLREGGYDAERPSVEQREEMRADVGADFFDTVIEGKPPRTVS